MSTSPLNQIGTQHSTWVKVTHWIGTISFIFLLITGIEMIMVHPRFYWGNVGNDLTPALFELPVSHNYQHGGWERSQPFFNNPSSPVSASRTYDIFNQNGWGRSLHFLSAWVLVFTGVIYLLTALYTKHVQRNILPGKNELGYKQLYRDIADHLRMRIAFVKGPQYGLLQKISYSVVLFFLVPVIVLTGLTMSPAVTASCPFLLTMFFGAQSARTIHFFAAVLLVLFLIIHIVMIIRSGFKKHMLAMTVES
jgi:thiosulfate reductase cytochrome b subunit